MEKHPFYTFLLIIILSLAASGCQPAPQLQTGEDTLFQYSTLASLTAGVYDGDMTFAALKQHGDFGVGTFNTLDGEMVQVDNQVYQIKADGVAYPVDDAAKTPFAVVTSFAPDQTVNVTELMDCEQLKTHIDGLLPSENIPYAIKVTGIFRLMQTRSVPSQVKPYPPLAEVVKTQPTFEFRDVEGIMVGFRLPAYMAGVNAAGYHFHFITTDKTSGGHVLSCEVQDVTVEIDHTDEWEMDLPSNQAFYKVDLSGDAP